MSEPKRLNIDWDSLFPGDELKILGTTIIIKPLGLLKLAKITKALKGFGNQLGKDDVNWNNYQEHQNIAKIASTLLDQFPDVLSEASCIHIEDLNLMLPEHIIAVVDKVVEVNLKSRKSLEKNFKSLAEKFEMATQTKKKKKISAKLSKN